MENLPCAGLSGFLKKPELEPQIGRLTAEAERKLLADLLAHAGVTDVDIAAFRRFGSARRLSHKAHAKRPA
jgi:hypothetical protein